MFFPFGNDFCGIIGQVSGWFEEGSIGMKAEKDLNHHPKRLCGGGGNVCTAGADFTPLSQRLF
jgi:hypothetical protein